ncbi:helix-turn-helix domain-containing protein [bacterium]|nr:helix-turn-helix domain-containing protein [bacterium]
MEHLWEQRGKIVTFDDLINALYPDEQEQPLRSDPKESADKIVERLRKALEPEREVRQPSRYILAVRGKAYRLAAFTETHPGLSG